MCRTLAMLVSLMLVCARPGCSHTKAAQVPSAYLVQLGAEHPDYPDSDYLCGLGFNPESPTAALASARREGALQVKSLESKALSPRTGEFT
jgi:hypothetical protein